MDQSSTPQGVAQATSRAGLSLASTGDGEGEASSANPAALSLVSGRLLLAHADEAIPGDWKNAVDNLTHALRIDASWVATKPTGSLLQKARRVVGSGAEDQEPVFAPWRVISPTAFQMGPISAAPAGAQWVASYLFDFGPTCPTMVSPIDVALMSPCPEVCFSDDALVGPLPRMNTLATMVRAAASEGRTKLAIIVREAARATLATRLLAFDPSLNDASLEIEFVSIEDAVVRLQRGAPHWDGIIAMPDMRGIVFAMLAEASGIKGPWPMLWFDRGLRLVTSEAHTGASASAPLNATALMQSLALLARRSGRQYAAQRLYESWAARRDSGIVTKARGSSAPYVNEIDEAAFIDQAVQDRSGNTRALPVWRGVVCEQSEQRAAQGPVRLSLVS